MRGRGGPRGGVPVMGTIDVLRSGGGGARRPAAGGRARLLRGGGGRVPQRGPPARRDPRGQPRDDRAGGHPLLYLGLWSLTAFSFGFGIVTLLLAAAAVPRRARRRSVRRFVLFAAVPVVLGLLVGLLVPGARPEPDPAATSRPLNIGIAATPQTTTSRLWSVGPQWWALVWDEASGSYTFQRRTTTGGRWQDAGQTSRLPAGTPSTCCGPAPGLVVVVAGSASDAGPPSCGRLRSCRTSTGRAG